jgi:hypothetical protein
MNTSTCECQWYKRDLSIMVGDDKYNKDAGFSWIPVESNFNTLSLTTSAVPY